MNEIQLNNYRHSVEIPVRFMDIDALQHVNNARYLNFLEESRIAYSQDLLNTYNSIKELTTTNKKGEFPSAKAVQTLVAFDPKTNQTAPIDDKLRKRIIELEPDLAN